MHGLLAGGGATDKHGNPKAGPSEGKRRWLVLIATHRRRIEQCPLAVSSDVNTGGQELGVKTSSPLFLSRFGLAVRR